MCFSFGAAVFVPEIGFGKTPTVNTHMMDYAKMSRIRIEIFGVKMLKSYVYGFNVNSKCSYVLILLLTIFLPISKF